MADSRTLEIILKAKDEASKVMDGVSDKAGKFNAGTLAAGVGAAGIAAATATAAALNKAADAAQSYGSQVVTIQRLTGLNAKASSDAAAMMDRYGISGKALGTVFKSLDMNIIAKDTSKSTTALHQLGIATEDATGKHRDSMSVLRDLADYYSKAKDKTEATAMAAKVLGKGYMSLLPVLAGGSSAIDKLTDSAHKNGLELDQNQIDSVKAYGAAQKANEAAMKGMEVQVGMAVLPIKTELVKAIGQVFTWLNAHKGEIVAWVTNTYNAAKPIIDALRILFGAWLGGQSAQWGALQKALAAAWKFAEPVLKEMWRIVAESLVPAWDSLKKAWAELQPTIAPLMPYLKGFAIFLAGALFLAIVGIIVIVAKLIQGLAWLIEKVVYLDTQFRSAFANIVRAAWDFLSQFTQPIQQAAAALGNLNPFQRHSPSLIDNVLAGVSVIKGAYGGLGAMHVPTPAYALSGAGSASFSGSTQVVVQLDGRTIARALGSHVKQTSRTGAK